VTHPDPLLERAKNAIAALLLVVRDCDAAKVDGEACLEVVEATDVLHELREYIAGKRLAAS
jgi:hypothetical protein